MQIAVVAHVYYPDLWPEIAAYLRKWPSKDFLLYVTSAEDRIERVKSTIGDEFDAVFICAPNRGKDIGQFLNCLPSIRADIICKVHTKKSAWAYGEAWRKELYRGTLGISPESVLAAFEREPTLGILAPEGHLLPHRVWWERNVQLVMQLAGEIGATDNLLPFRFPAGAMFWARAAALAPLLKLSLRLSDFEEESGQTDGTLSHAIERLFPIAARLAGYETLDTGSLPMLMKVFNEHLSVPWWAGNGDLQIAETNAVDTKETEIVDLRNHQAQEQQTREDLMRQLAASKRNDLDEMLPRKLTGWRWIPPGRRKKLRRLIREYRLIAASPLFDSRWYLAKNADVALTREDPALHYLLHGGLEGRAPGPHFDGGAYLRVNPDVVNSRSNPLLHYILRGHKENRRITCVGNGWSERYPDTYSEVAAAGVKPDATLANALQRVGVLENRARILESALELETGRIDWACPSSDELRHVAGLQKGGSGSSVIEIMRHAGGAASDDLRLSGA